MTTCSSHPQAQRSSLNLAARVVLTLAILGIAGPSTAAPPTPKPSAPGPSTPGAPLAAEGGTPLEESLIPPGSGWFCFAIRVRNAMECFRTKAECSEQHYRARVFATMECTSLAPWVTTGGDDPHKGHHLNFYKDKATCLKAVSTADKSIWFGSGCAAVP